MLQLHAQVARELMVPGSHALADTTTAEQASEKLTSLDVGAAVVIDLAGHPIGVVTKTDLLIHAHQLVTGQRFEPATVREVMTPAVFSCHEETPVRIVIEEFLMLNVQHLFVTDHQGVVVGLITPIEVLKKLS